MPDQRPACPTCQATHDRLRLRASPDIGFGNGRPDVEPHIVAVYPCGCWLSPTAARALVREYRRYAAGSAR